MKKKHLILLGLTLLLSCNIRFEKRLYNNGYYVDITAKHYSKHVDANDISAKNNLQGAMPSFTDNAKPANDVVVSSKNNLNESLIGQDDNAVASIRATEPILSFQNRFVSNKSHIEYSTFFANFSKQTSKIAKADNYTEKESENADIKMLLFAAFLGLTLFGFFRFVKAKSFRASRWAQSHKVTSKILIGLMQISNTALGILIGKDLSALGYHFSNSLEYIAGGIMVIGLIGMALNQRKDGPMLVRQFYLKKLSIITICMSFFMISTAIGNKISSHRQQISPLGYIAEKIDNTVWNQSNTSLSSEKSDSETEPAKALTTKKHKENKVKSSKAVYSGLLALWIILSALLILGLVILVCFLFCNYTYGAAVPLLILTVALAIALPLLIVRWTKRQREKLN